MELYNLWKIAYVASRTVQLCKSSSLGFVFVSFQLSVRNLYHSKVGGWIILTLQETLRHALVFYMLWDCTSALSHIFNAYLPGKPYEATIDYFVVLLIKTKPWAVGNYTMESIRN